jgi:hypothetical protein
MGKEMSPCIGFAPRVCASVRAFVEGRLMTCLGIDSFDLGYILISLMIRLDLGLGSSQWEAILNLAVLIMLRYARIVFGFGSAKVLVIELLVLLEKNGSGLNRVHFLLRERTSMSNRLLHRFHN